MPRVIVAALVGALVGWMVLSFVAHRGGPAEVVVPVPQIPVAGSTAPPRINDVKVNLEPIVGKLAAVLGVCTGAVVGALAGSAAVPKEEPTVKGRRF